MRIGTWAVGPHLHVMQTRTQGTPRRHRDRLNTLAAGDRGIRTTVTGHVTPSEWLSPKKENIKSAKNKPERGCLPGRGGRGRNDAAALKASLRALQKAKRDPGTAALRVDPMLAGARVTAAKSCDRPSVLRQVRGTCVRRSGGRPREGTTAQATARRDLDYAVPSAAGARGTNTPRSHRYQVPGAGPTGSLYFMGTES